MSKASEFAESCSDLHSFEGIRDVLISVNRNGSCSISVGLAKSRDFVVSPEEMLKLRDWITEMFDE